MAYDEALAARIRMVQSDEPGLTEKKMFGGIGWMLDGNMAVGAGSKGQMILRVSKQTWNELLDGESYLPMEAKGRAMSGWLLVPAERVADDEALREIMQLGIDHARSLPPK